MKYVSRFKAKYEKEVVPALQEQFQYGNHMELPKLVKICINQGVGQATQDKKLVDIALEEMTKIAGQRAVITKAKTSISNFKLREGMPIGVRVTLRGVQMWEFLDRLIAVALPRVREGVSRDTLVSVCTVVHAGMMTAVSLAPNVWLAAPAMLVLGASRKLLDRAGVPVVGEDQGMLVRKTGDKGTAQAFIDAVAMHRFPERETDPPLV